MGTPEISLISERETSTLRRKSTDRTFRLGIVSTFAFLFVLTSIWTDPIGTLGEGIMGRIVPSDLFGAIAIGLFLVTSRALVYPKQIYPYLFFIITLTPGILVSYRQTSTLIELLILVFLGLIFVVLTVQFATPEALNFLIFAFALASLLAAFIGTWNVLSSVVGLPRIPVMNPRSGIVGIGTFRNTGQAGAYMLISLTVLIPAKVSDLYRQFSEYQKRVISYAIPLCVIFLVLSIKRASLIGFLIGLSLWSVSRISKGVFKIGKLKISSLIYIILVVAFIYLILSFNVGANQSWLNWWQYKIVGGIPSALETEEGSFMSENYSLAFEAFEDNPLFGSGIAGFAGRYMKYEVHSTYLKMLGEAGLFGVVGYLVFMIASSHAINSVRKFRNTYSSFLRNAFPFLIGCVISWSYTYHLRKREFWIMFAILILAASLAKKSGTQGKNKSIEHS